MGESKIKSKAKSLMRNNSKDMFFLALGILMYSIGYSAYILPEKVVMGGVAGAAALIYYATGIPTGTSILVLNAAMLFIAFRSEERR